MCKTWNPTKKATSYNPLKTRTSLKHIHNPLLDRRQRNVKVSSTQLLASTRLALHFQPWSFHFPTFRPQQIKKAGVFPRISSADTDCDPELKWAYWHRGSASLSFTFLYPEGALTHWIYIDSCATLLSEAQLNACGETGSLYITFKRKTIIQTLLPSRWHNLLQGFITVSDNIVF